MEETRDSTCGQRGLQVLRCQSPRSEQADRTDGAGGLWLNHLHPQVWCDTAGGDDGAQTFPYTANVPRADVLLGARRSRRRSRLRQRRSASPRLAWIALSLGLLSLAGCKDHQRASLEKRYAEARLQFQQGYDDQPLQRAEQGFKDSAQHLDLNWKFRILAAEAHIRKGRQPKALELLEPEPPTNAPAEVPWRRKLNQAAALCQLHRYVEANERLGQAEALIGELRDRRAELAYFRGRCELSNNQWNKAEQYLRD